MLSDTIILGKDSTTTRTYRVIGYPNGGGSERVAADSLVGQPKRMSIKHQKTGSGDLASDRHLISLSAVKNNSSGKPQSCIVNLTLQIPSNGLFTMDDVKEQVQQLIYFLQADATVLDTAPSTTELGDMELVGTAFVRAVQGES